MSLINLPYFASETDQPARAWDGELNATCIARMTVISILFTGKQILPPSQKSIHIFPFFVRHERVCAYHYSPLSHLIYNNTTPPNIL